MMGKNFEADQLANITVKETGKLQNVVMHIIMKEMCQPE